ncbi:hypothetical protein Tco_0772756 [Tanacetum coccineum]|uniref:Uncharacterized protein n=1 Tax=Tanacetum coccineum TaxID=301880 RepID=A0ABQ4ZIZ4_9ASTR
MPMNEFCAKKGIKRDFSVARTPQQKCSPKDNDVQDSEDVANKEGQHQMTEDEQVLHDELEKIIAQEVVAKALDDATRQAFEKREEYCISKEGSSNYQY